MRFCICRNKQIDTNKFTVMQFAWPFFCFEKCFQTMFVPVLKANKSRGFFVCKMQVQNAVFYIFAYTYVQNCVNFKFDKRIAKKKTSSRSVHFHQPLVFSHPPPQKHHLQNFTYNKQKCTFTNALAVKRPKSVLEKSQSAFRKSKSTLYQAQKCTLGERESVCLQTPKSRTYKMRKCLFSNAKAQANNKQIELL